MKNLTLIKPIVLEEIRPKAAMFDTHIFDKLLQEKPLLEKLPRDIKCYATDIQYEEITKISNIDYREILLDFFNKIIEEKIQSIHGQWLSFGHSNFHEARFCSPEERDTLKNFSNGNPHHIEDALILLTAKYSNMVMISNDKGAPFKRAKKEHYNVLTLEEFLERYSLQSSSDNK